MTTDKTLENPPPEYFLSLKYPISIYPEKEGGYTALIPDLLGCISQGETLEEVIINIEEARALWIETVYFSGKKKIPLPSRKKRGFAESRYE
jgi:predicted RNase H-like HicB family nuclease